MKARGWERRGGCQASLLCSSEWPELASLGTPAPRGGARAAVRGAGAPHQTPGAGVVGSSLAARLEIRCLLQVAGTQVLWFPTNRWPCSIPASHAGSPRPGSGSLQYVSGSDSWWIISCAYEWRQMPSYTAARHARQSVAPLPGRGSSRLTWFCCNKEETGGDWHEGAFTILPAFFLEKVSHEHDGLLTGPEGHPGDTKKYVFTLLRRENVKELRVESSIHFLSEEHLSLQAQVFKYGNGLFVR